MNQSNITNINTYRNQKSNDYLDRSNVIQINKYRSPEDKNHWNYKDSKLRKFVGAVALATTVFAFGSGFYAAKEMANASDVTSEINRDEIAQTWPGRFDYGEGGIKALKDTLSANGIDAKELGISTTYEGQELQQLFNGKPHAGDEFLVHQMKDGDLRFEIVDSDENSN